MTRLAAMGFVFQCIAMLVMLLTAKRDLRQRIAIVFTGLALICWIWGAPWIR